MMDNYAKIIEMIFAGVETLRNLGYDEEHIKAFSEACYALADIYLLFKDLNLAE